MIWDHLAKPGPDYWDYRCLVCGEPVRDHAGVWRMLWKKLRGKR